MNRNPYVDDKPVGLWQLPCVITGAFMLFLLILWLTGCSQIDRPPPPPDDAADIRVRLRPVVVGGAWKTSDVFARLVDLPTAYAHTGIAFDVLSIRNTDELPADIEPSSPDAAKLRAIAREYQDRGEFAVMFFDTVSSNGQQIGGAAWLPPAVGTLIAFSSCPNVVSHETGHWAALNHTDPLRGPTVACRTMGYTACTTKDPCRGKTFIADEIEIMRAALLTHRRPTVTITDKAVARAKVSPPKSATGDLIVCPRDDAPAAAPPKRLRAKLAIR